MTVGEALKSIDWRFIHPCGHPSQRVEKARPPCAMCWKGDSQWRTQLPLERPSWKLIDAPFDTTLPLYDIITLRIVLYTVGFVSKSTRKTCIVKGKLWVPFYVKLEDSREPEIIDE